MTVWFVSRHPGAAQWAAEQALVIDRAVPHLDLAQIHPGDIVAGTLPINLAASVCAQGARYLHLSLELSEQQRGRELSAAELRQCGARLTAYRVEPDPAGMAASGLASK